MRRSRCRSSWTIGSQARSLSGLAAYANWSASLAGDGITERLQGARMSANAFDVLGVSPAAGRLLDDSDDRPMRRVSSS